MQGNVWDGDLVTRLDPVEHPVVRVRPETGRRSLFVNPGFTAHIVGVSEHESRAILDLLFAHLTKPEHIVRHRWQPGDVVMCDNRGPRTMPTGTTTTSAASCTASRCVGTFRWDRRDGDREEGVGARVVDRLAVQPGDEAARPGSWASESARTRRWRGGVASKLAWDRRSGMAGSFRSDVLFRRLGGLGW